jgi:hypothetical protein
MAAASGVFANLGSPRAQRIGERSMIGNKWNNRVTFGGLALMFVFAASLAAYALGPTPTPAPSAGGARQLPATTAFSAATAVTVTGQPPLPAAAAAPDKPKAELCLGCHGPFDKLKARTAAYSTAEGQKVNPHLNVPHKSTNMTTCTECHDVHPVPVTRPVKIAKASLQYCYAACHHMNDFTPCVQCHKDMK